jgi:regulator of replication initiation timing
LCIEQYEKKVKENTRLKTENEELKKKLATYELPE